MSLHVVEPDPEAQKADRASEVAVLGWLLDSRGFDVVSEVWSLLSPDDFMRPQHQVIARVCQSLFLNGERTDPVRVLQELVSGDLLREAGDPGYLQTCLRYGATGDSNAIWHVKRIVEAARTREATTLLTRGLQQLTQPGMELLPFVTDLQEQLAALQTDASVSIDLGMVDFLDFLEQQDAPVDFVIDGMLGRREKAMFTGGEGLGKSTLLRQLAICVAAGLNPLTRDFVPPRRVLWLDAENHEDTSRRLFRKMYEHGVLPQGRSITRGFLTLRHLQHVDLLADRDITAITRMVTECRPELIYIGPLYQMVGGSLNDEEVAQKVVRTLNRVCNIGNAAMLIEAHAGHGKGRGGDREWRPRGSSALLGWPDFGFGLGLADEDGAEVMRLMDVHRWRGERHADRLWPKQLVGGGGNFPWDRYS